MICCDICCDNFPQYEIYSQIQCCTVCRECMASWVESQIGDGQSLALKCNCRSTDLNYRNISCLFPFLSAESQEKYRYTKRLESMKNEYHLITCPDCSSEIWIPHVQRETPCSNATCTLFGSLICVKHRVELTRANPADLSKPKRCPKCVEECGGDGLLASVMSSIQDAFCDRCPGCNGYVGEPQSLDFCLCLKCNHCPICFCGFCYKFAGSWNDTHVHVRHCPMNPRENYFAESEEIWRGLMRVRRQRLGEAIIAASTLSEEKKQEARRRMENLIK